MHVECTRRCVHVMQEPQDAKHLGNNTILYICVRHACNVLSHSGDLSAATNSTITRRVPIWSTCACVINGSPTTTTTYTYKCSQHTNTDRRARTIASVFYAFAKVQTHYKHTLWLTNHFSVKVHCAHFNVCVCKCALYLWNNNDVACTVVIIFWTGDIYIVVSIVYFSRSKLIKQMMHDEWMHVCDDYDARTHGVRGRDGV